MSSLVAFAWRAITVDVLSITGNDSRLRDGEFKQNHVRRACRLVSYMPLGRLERERALSFSDSAYHLATLRA